MSSPNAVASAAARHRGAVLKAYRDLVDVVRRSSPVAARDAMLEEARTEIRAHAAETDESKRLDLLRKLVARVGYLRIVTPKGGRHKREGGTFVVRKGSSSRTGARARGRGWLTGRSACRKRTNTTTGS